MTVVQSDQYGPAPASTAASPGSQGAAQAQPQAIPFVRASRRASQQDFASAGVTLGASQQQIGPVDIQTNGFLRFLEAYVSQTAAANSATVALRGDAPFNILQNITLQDPSSEFIISPYSGYELMLAEKYFGYAGDPPWTDPRSDPNYVATTGSGGTAGTIAFTLKIPLEDRARDAFCAVPNSAANKNYRFQAYWNTETGVFSTAPTAEPTNGLTVSLTNFYWTEPPASIAGAPTVPTPNGNGSVAYLDRETFSSIAGLSNPTLILKNVGRVFKQILFVLYDTSSPAVRTDAQWPDPATVWVNGFPLYYKPKKSWQTAVAYNYGYGNLALAAGATKDVKGGLDTGVYPTYDLFAQPGRVTNWGPADQMLPTVPTTKVSIIGVWGASAGTLVCLERTIKPSSGAALFS